MPADPFARSEFVGVTETLDVAIPDLFQKVKTNVEKCTPKH